MLFHSLLTTLFCAESSRLRASMTRPAWPSSTTSTLTAWCGTTSPATTRNISSARTATLCWSWPGSPAPRTLPAEYKEYLVMKSSQYFYFVNKNIVDVIVSFRPFKTSQYQVSLGKALFNKLTSTVYIYF